jgi:excisionase family DNA binding protein
MAKQYIILTEADLPQLIEQSVTAALLKQQEKAKPDNSILTQQQAAELLNISIPTLIKWKDKKLLPFSQIDRKIYFKKQDVLNAIASLSNKHKG